MIVHTASNPLFGRSEKNGFMLHKHPNPAPRRHPGRTFFFLTLSPELSAVTNSILHQHEKKNYKIMRFPRQRKPKSFQFDLLTLNLTPLFFPTHFLNAPSSPSFPAFHVRKKEVG